MNSIALKNLQDMGLTVTQAKIYLVVLRETSCNFGHISKISHVARSEVYREIGYLEKAGLVEKTLDRPKIVKALPVKIALKNFVDCHKKKLESDISSLESVLIDFLKNNCPSERRTIEVNPNDMEFTLISSRNLILSKMMSMLDEAEEEVLIRYLPRKICAILQLCSNSINHALKSNVDFNIITTRDDFTKALVDAIRSNIGDGIGNIKLRESPSIPFGLIMIDQKQLLFDTKPEEIFSGKQMLWTNCPAILSTMYHDFEQDWFNIKKIEFAPWL